MKTFASIAGALALAASISGAAKAQMMGHQPPVPMTPAQFSSTLPGQSVQIAVRVRHVDRNTIQAVLLQHVTGAVSKATHTAVVLYFPDGTPVIMGSARDVTPGAVLFVYGVVTKPYHVDVKRLVVDTQYVKVE